MGIILIRKSSSARMDQHRRSGTGPCEKRKEMQRERASGTMLRFPSGFSLSIKAPLRFHDLAIGSGHGYAPLAARSPIIPSAHGEAADDPAAAVMESDNSVRGATSVWQSFSALLHLPGRPQEEPCAARATRAAACGRRRCGARRRSITRPSAPLDGCQQTDGRDPRVGEEPWPVWARPSPAASLTRASPPLRSALRKEQRMATIQL